MLFYVLIIYLNLANSTNFGTNVLKRMAFRLAKASLDHILLYWR